MRPKPGDLGRGNKSPQNPRAMPLTRGNTWDVIAVEITWFRVSGPVLPSPGSA
ncbi:MAG TPA: hypothetical protein PLP19_00975 [bacterium]|nr:hypothetical protein [bacterium]HPN42036.1 hypothetical protein [bacterium]